MHVVGLVTGHALHARLGHLLSRLHVTGTAIDARVRAVEREASPRAVVELPARPALGRMAIYAALAELALVDVVGAMACDTLARRFAIAAVLMAGLARGDRVHPRKRESCQVVI